MLIKYKILLPKGEEWKLERGQYGQLISTGLSMGLMGCIVNLGSVVLQGANNSLGTSIVAAHTASRRLFDIMTVMLYTISLAMTTFASQNMGAKKYDRIRQGLRHAFAIDSVITLFLIAFCYGLGRPLLTWITSSSDPAVIDAAVMYTRISILFFFILGPLLELRCALQGMNRKVVPVMTSVLEMVLKMLSAMFLVPWLGYLGVALTEPISWIAMTIVLGIAYLKVKPE